MSEECVRHRDWNLIAVVEEEGGEFYVYARCEVCGTLKSALVDFTRDWSNASECHESSVERYENSRGVTINTKS